MYVMKEESTDLRLCVEEDPIGQKSSLRTAAREHT